MGNHRCRGWAQEQFFRGVCVIALEGNLKRLDEKLFGEGSELAKVTQEEKERSDLLHKYHEAFYGFYT